MAAADRDDVLTLVTGSPTRLEWRVHHELPGRTRFRLVSSMGHRATSGAVEQAVEAVPGVQQARYSEETGSLLVLHDGARDTRQRLRRALEALELGATGPGCAPAPRPDLVKAAVLSLVRAALPPAPRAALQLVESLATARGPRPGRA